MQIVTMAVSLYFSFQMMASSMSSVDGPQSQWDAVPPGPRMDVLHIRPTDLLCLLSQYHRQPGPTRQPHSGIWGIP